MKSKILALSSLLLLSSLSAFAADVPVANLIVTVHKDCNSGAFSGLSTDTSIASDYQVELVSKTPMQCDTDAFLGKPERFRYDIASDGTVTIQKKGDRVLRLFGHDTSIVLGTVDMSNMCNGILPPNGLVAKNLVVNLLPNIKVTQDIQLSDSCTQSARGQAYAFNRAFTSTVNIADGNVAFTLSLSSTMLFADQIACQNLMLP